MYICTDCKSEYKEKPEYCDCGNNLFEEIKTEAETETKKIDVEDDDLEEFLSQPRETKKIRGEGSFLDQYPQLKEKLGSLDNLSIIIFSACIFLSIVAWCAIGSGPQHQRSSGDTQAVDTEQTSSESSNSPDIDSIWDNKPDRKSNDVSQNQTSQETQDTNTQPQEQGKNSEESTPAKGFFGQPIFNSQKPAQNEQKPAQKPTQNVQKPALRPRQTPMTQSNDRTPAAPTTSLNPKVMNKYKIGLRQALFSHLSVATIQGSGKCVVEFSVAQNGKLLNRRFAKLSDNKSLNDAVYNMLMSLPQYYPPPSGYNGEKIRLSFYFNNGYYEVSL